MSRALVFVGPTVSREEILHAVPDVAVEVFPPIAAGDLLRLDLAPGDLVAIIDGFYLQHEAVRHKEILSLLDAGVHVWGAASMGALRAAELEIFGMTGFGRVFEAYKQGDIVGDDEVAVLHAPEEMAYRNLTEALVNIRHCCQRAVESGVISVSERELIVEGAQALPFYERTYHRVLERGIELGVSTTSAEGLLRLVRNEHLDVKRDDARKLVRAIRTGPVQPARCDIPWNETVYLRDWKMYWHGAQTLRGDYWLSELDVLIAGQLFLTCYPALHRRILLKKLAAIAEQALGEYSPHPLYPEARRKGEVPATHVSPDASGLQEHAQTELVARYLSDQYGFCLDKSLPEAVDRWLHPEERVATVAQQLARVAVRLWVEPRSADWRNDVLQALKASSTFQSLVPVADQAKLLQARLQHEKHFDISKIPEGRVMDWFMQRWGATRENMELLLRDRGFKNARHFVYHAGSYYILDKYTGVNLSEGIEKWAMESV